MKREVVLSLAEKWEKEVLKDQNRDVSDSAKLHNAELNGRNKGFSICAKELKMLVDLLEC